mmetsp:Transcript_43700/g.121544  ORF Transcript_43700/g.121544 Transcript_43700/m.121544 type:complete len:220 (-) Transcript_43700:371-1030(-)
MPSGGPRAVPSQTPPASRRRPKGRARVRGLPRGRRAAGSARPPAARYVHVRVSVAEAPGLHRSSSSLRWCFSISLWCAKRLCASLAFSSSSLSASASPTAASFCRQRCARWLTARISTAFVCCKLWTPSSPTSTPRRAASRDSTSNWDKARAHLNTASSTEGQPSSAFTMSSAHLWIATSRFSPPLPSGAPGEPAKCSPVRSRFSGGCSGDASWKSSKA